MKVDPRFALTIEDRGRWRALLFRATRELVLEEAAAEFARAGIEELAELAGVPPGARDAFRDAAGDRWRAWPGRGDEAATVLVNGWQSWSGAAEVAPGEASGLVGSGRSALPILNRYVDGPAGAPRHGELVSYFIASFRSGGRRLLVASLGQAEGAAAATMPPIAFRIRRAAGDVAMQALARGGSFDAGALVAVVGLHFADGYFAAKDALAEAFRGAGGPPVGGRGPGRGSDRFERLAFLGRDGRLVPGGYESWYNRYTKIDERGILRDLAAMGANGNLVNRFYLERGRPTVFQVDDGWERAVGDWEPDPVKFPGGMAGLASRIEEAGMIPGLWLAPFLVTRRSAAFRDRPDWLLRDGSGRPVRAGWNPGWDGLFHCLDLSLPEVGDYLAAVFERVVEQWGYRYLKLDFLYAAFLGGERGRGGAAFEHYERVIGRITSKTRDSGGRPVAWLGCGAPLEPSIRHFPLMRIGADTKEDWDWGTLRPLLHGGRPAAYTNLSHTIGRAILDGSVLASDPDVVFCRDSRIRLSEREKELVAVVDRALASQVMFSDDASEFGSEAAFTGRVVALFDRLDGREYGAERVGRDLYWIFSRDGRVFGWANLGAREAVVPGARALTAEAAGSIVLRGRFKPGGLELEPHSVSLFSA